MTARGRTHSTHWRAPRLHLTRAQAAAARNLAIVALVLALSATLLSRLWRFAPVTLPAPRASIQADA